MTKQSEEVMTVDQSNRYGHVVGAMIARAIRRNRMEELRAAIDALDKLLGDLTEEEPVIYRTG